jgi:hypothetical protein
MYLAQDHSDDDNERSVGQHDQGEPPLLGEGNNERCGKGCEALNHDRKLFPNPCLYLLHITGGRMRGDE